jgi:hypothetical protein
MWLIGFFWLWSLVVLPMLNGVFRLGVPLPPFDSLMALTGIYMALYMGGHTVLRALDRRGPR